MWRGHMWRGRRGGPQGVGDQESHGGGVRWEAARQHPWGVSVQKRGMGMHACRSLAFQVV